MTYNARISCLLLMAAESRTSWTFLTSHARVLICIAQDPGMRLREIGERAGITERAAHRVVGDLAAAGYVARERHGRRNRYTINSNLTLPDPVARRQRVGDLLAVLTEPSSAPPAFDAAPAAL
jgi:MarR family